MLKATLNSSLRLIRTKNLYYDGDELSVVYCTTGIDACVKYETSMMRCAQAFCLHTMLIPPYDTQQTIHDFIGSFT